MDSFHRADWIGLAQAVGGMLAVAAAFLVTWLQSRHSSKLRRLDSLERLDGLAKLVEIASLRIQQIENDAVTNGSYVVVPGEVVQAVAAVLDALDEVSISDTPSALTVHALMEAKTAARRARNFVMGGNAGQGTRFYFKDIQPIREIVDALCNAEANLHSEHRRLSRFD